MAFLYTRLRLHVDVWFPLFGIVGLGTCSITGLTRRRQIREAGLLGRGIRLIRWAQIESHEISPIGALSLKIRNKGWAFLCDLPPGRYSEVEAILANRQA